MQTGWTKIFSSFQLFEAVTAEEVLQQNGIETLIDNRLDSMIPSLGEAYLYVPAEKALLALWILKQNNILPDSIDPLSFKFKAR